MAKPSKPKPPPPKPAPVVDDDFFDEGPPPRTSVLNVILCILNVIAAAVFIFFLLIDVETRRTWSYRVFLYDLRIQGLPLEEEGRGPSASRINAPQPKPTPALLREAYQERKTGVSVKGDFAALEEGPYLQIEPRHLTEEVLKDHFGSLTPQYTTLEDEVKFNIIEKSIFADLTAAGKQIAAAEKTLDDKRLKLEQILVPLGCDIKQVEALDKLVRSAADETALDQHIAEATERRMLIDILEAVESIRPGDTAKPYLQKGGDLSNLSLKNLQDKLRIRLENAITENYQADVYYGQEWDNKKRDTVEKRHNIAMLIFAIYHAVKPDGNLLYPQGPERAQVVCGLMEFARCSQIHVLALKSLEKNVVDLIKADRQGDPYFKDDKTEGGTTGFIHRYAELVTRLKATVQDLDQAQKGIKRLEDQGKLAKQIFEERQMQLDEAKRVLLVEREKTAKQLAQLKVMQGLLFRAELSLADAAEINFLLEIELRRAEGLIPKKGAR